MSLDIKKIFTSFIKQNKLEFSKYMVYSLASPLINVVLPHYYGKILESLKEQKEITSYFKIVTIIWIVISFLNFKLLKLETIIIPKLHVFITDYIINHFVSNLKESNKLDMLKINNIIIKLPSLIEKIIYQFKSNILPILLVLGSTIFYMLYINISLGSLFIVFMMLGYAIIYNYASKCGNLSKESNDSANDLLDYISDIISNVNTIHTYNTHDYEKELLQQKFEENKKIHIQTIKCGGEFKNIMSTYVTIILFSMCSYAYKLYTSNILPLNNTISIFIINMFTFQQLTDLNYELRYFFYNLGLLYSLQDIIKDIDAPSTITNYKPLINNYMLCINNLNVVFGNKKILNNISLTIPKNQKVGIIGPVGSGKTCLFLSLVRLCKFSGSITIDNHDIKNIDIDYLRNNIMYINQQPSLFNRSVYENILYGTPFAPKDVDVFFTKFDLTFIFKNIDMNKPVGKNGEFLSGGQRQLIALSRCFFQNTKILLLDEVTSSLNQELKHKIMNLLEVLMSDKTVIVISHDTYLLNKLDRIITINSGFIEKDELN
jgi:ABC-type multidrug transport system fused ATPase/permease subunit